MTDNDDTGQPARLPALEKGLRFRDRGRLGKLPDEASGSEWAAMLQGTGYGSSAWWGHKINRAIRQRDLKATTRGIIKRAEILRWLEQYDAMPDGWRTLTVHTPAISASTSSSVSEKEALAPERTILREMADYLPLREQARLGYLPDALHVEQIATLEYPDNRDLALAYAKVLRKACKECELTSTEEQYQDWWIEDGATGEVSQEFQWWYKALFEETDGGSTPLITRSIYRDWLLQKGQLLPAWWFPEPKKQTPKEEIRNKLNKKLSLRNPCSVPYWITVEWWTLEQASFILLGHEPINDDDIPLGGLFPWNTAPPANKRLYEALRAAAEVGTIATVPITRNGRDGYRIKNIDAYRWLRQVYGETVHVPTDLVEFFEAMPLPAPKQVEPAKPSLPISVSDTDHQSIKLRPDQADKRDCQSIALRLLSTGIPRHELKNHSEIAPYACKYPGKNTLSKWFAEIDPRPKDKRRGRPKKTPS